MNNWISLKDRLPEAYIPILITGSGYICTAILVMNRNKSYYFEGHGFFGYDWEWEFKNSDVTHWMELPKLPK